MSDWEQPSDPGLNMSMCSLDHVLLPVPSIDREVNELSYCFYMEIKNSIYWVKHSVNFLAEKT